ncbi:MAG: transposase [Acidimicrobiales bacterium]
MVALLVYAYCLGVRSSRQIERACHQDVGFQVICAGLFLDHTTFAWFRARHEDELTESAGSRLPRSSLTKSSKRSAGPTRPTSPNAGHRRNDGASCNGTAGSRSARKTWVVHHVGVRSHKQKGADRANNQVYPTRVHPSRARRSEGLHRRRDPSS